MDIDEESKEEVTPRGRMNPHRTSALTRLRGLEAKNNYFQASKARKPAILQGFRFQKGL